MLNFKYLADTKHFVSMRMLTDLTYLPDLTICELMNLWDKILLIAKMQMIRKASNKLIG